MKNMFILRSNSCRNNNDNHNNNDNNRNNNKTYTTADETNAEKKSNNCGDIGNNRLGKRTESRAQQQQQQQHHQHHHHYHHQQQQQQKQHLEQAAASQSECQKRTTNTTIHSRITSQRIRYVRYNHYPPLPNRLCAALYPFMLCLLLSIAPTPAQADWLMDCGDCHCKWNSGKKTADCKNLSLSTVPENLSSEVQVLDLSYNRIPYLEQNAFITAQLQNLHKLFIRNSTLQQIDPRSFAQLEILIELDLSNNLLRTLQPNLFARLIKVRALVLNGNLLESLADGVFQNLKYLHKVELKHNRLARIGTQVFVSVPLLSQIYLDSNQLSFLRKESFDGLKRLTALSLDQNPWNCTCELQIFRDFVLKRNLYTPPTSCFYPLHLRGMLWIEDQPEAFACKPKIIYPARGASINTSKENVTLICRVHASPNTLIAWDYNKQMYRANVATSSTGILGPSAASSSSSAAISSTLLGTHQSQRVHIQVLRDEQSKEKEFGRDVFISRLTILGAEKSDEGVYTCLAENAGGKDAVQMSLLVQKSGPRDLLLQGNIIIVICLMALGLLSVSVFLAMVTCCIYKRFKHINPGHHRHLHHLNMNTAEQMTVGSTAVGDHTTTNVVVTGGTDIMLGDVTSADNDSHSLSHYKPHKTNLNGGAKVNKYADVIKLHQVDGGVGKDNSLIVGYVGSNASNSGSSDGQHQHHHHHLMATACDAEKPYLERNSEDTLNLKYPHSAAQCELSYVAIAHAATTATTLAARSSSSGGRGVSPIGNIELLEGGRAGEYQPDLLPAYSGNLSDSIAIKQTMQQHQAQQHQQQPQQHQHQHQHQNQQQQQQQQQQLYSSITPTRLTNLKEQQQTIGSPAGATSTATATALATRAKYNINVQEYLQAKYGTIGGAVKSATSVYAPTSSSSSNHNYSKSNSGNNCNNGRSSVSDKQSKREAPSIPFSSMGATAGSKVQESGFATLQRHCKSLVLPTQRAAGTTTTTTPPTDQAGDMSSGYEYRQPPPPPYNAAHRTSGAEASASAGARLLTLQRRACAAGNELQPDHGGMAVDLSAGTTLTQTIVTASPSLNFLTTTGSYTPRRQLL